MWKLAWNFIEKHGRLFGTVDDVFGELALVFEDVYRKWDGTRNVKFITYLSYRCIMRLKDIERGRGPQKEAWRDGPNASHAVTRWNELCDNEWEPTAKQNGFFSMWCDLSNDARAVVRLVLDTPAGLARVIQDEGNCRFSFRSCIRAYLLGAGWAWERISNAYVEIGDHVGGYTVDPHGWEPAPEKKRKRR